MTASARELAKLYGHAPDAFVKEVLTLRLTGQMRPARCL